MSEQRSGSPAKRVRRYALSDGALVDPVGLGELQISMTENPQLFSPNRNSNGNKDDIDVSGSGSVSRAMGDVPVQHFDMGDVTNLLSKQNDSIESLAGRINAIQLDQQKTNQTADMLCEQLKSVLRDIRANQEVAGKVAQQTGNFVRNQDYRIKTLPEVAASQYAQASDTQISQKLLQEELQIHRDAIKLLEAKCAASSFGVGDRTRRSSAPGCLIRGRNTPTTTSAMDLDGGATVNDPYQMEKKIELTDKPR